MASMFHVHEQRIRYADTDRMGFAYQGILLPVVEAGCRYRRPVRYDEWIRVETGVTTVTRARLTIEYRIVGSEAETRASGLTVHCYMNRNGRAIRISPDWIDFFLGNSKIPFEDNSELFVK